MSEQLSDEVANGVARVAAEAFPKIKRFRESNEDYPKSRWLLALHPSGRYQILQMSESFQLPRIFVPIEVDSEEELRRALTARWLETPEMSDYQGKPFDDLD